MISPLPAGILSHEAPRDGDTAVCIVGGIRSLYYSKVHANILQNAIARLQPARVFFVLNTLKRLDVHGHGSGEQVPDALPMKRVYRALAAFQPSFVELYRRSGCGVVNETEPGRLCCDWEVGSFMQLHWIKHCFEEVQRYEADNRIRFGLYVRLRPDVFYYNPFPAPESLRQSNVTLTMKWAWDQPADWLFIVTRQGLVWFEDAYETLSGHCRAKHECLARLDSLSGEQKQACLKPNRLFDAPEYSSWYRQNPRGTFVTDSGRTFRFRSIALAPIIVRGEHKADCWRSLERRLDCERQSRRGWD